MFVSAAELKKKFLIDDMVLYIFVIPHLGHFLRIEKHFSRWEIVKLL